jgi:hypothetical protein
VPSNDRPIELEFPLGGVNLLTEYQEQPPGTTPSAENVRGLNPDTLKMRGGSRAGLARYIQDRVPANVSLSLLIQHLAVIVDPQAPAFRNEFLVPDDTWVEDPLNPGLYVPPGGSGNPPSSPQQDTNIAFVQKKGQNGFGIVSTEQTMVFDNAVWNGTNDRLVVIVVGTSHSSNFGVTVTVESDATGGTYTRVGQGSGNDGYSREMLGTDEVTISLWYRFVTSDAGEQTIRVTPSAAAFLKFFGANFSGLNAAPFVDRAFNSSGVATTALTTGLVDIAGEGRLLIGAFALGSSNTLNYEGEDDVEGLFQYEVGGTITSPLTGAPVMSAAYWISPNIVEDEIEATPRTGSVTYVAVGASFKD